MIHLKSKVAEPTEADMAMDLVEQLKATESAIIGLTVAGMDIPQEAHEIAGALRRAIYAESEVVELSKTIARMVECAHACDEVDAELTKLRADVERKDEALREVFSVISVLHGRGPDAVIPERVNTPIGIPIKLREIMAGVTAALADTADKQGEQT